MIRSISYAQKKIPILEESTDRKSVLTKIYRSVPSRTVTKFMAAPRRAGTSREHNAPRDVLRVNLNGCRDPISFRFFFCFFSHPDIRVLLHLPPFLNLRCVVRAPTRFPSYYIASRDHHRSPSPYSRPQSWILSRIRKSKDHKTTELVSAGQINGPVAPSILDRSSWEINSARVFHVATRWFVRRFILVVRCSFGRRFRLTRRLSPRTYLKYYLARQLSVKLR